MGPGRKLVVTDINIENVQPLELYLEEATIKSVSKRYRKRDDWPVVDCIDLRSLVCEADLKCDKKHNGASKSKVNGLDLASLAKQNWYLIVPFSYNADTFIYSANILDKEKYPIRLYDPLKDTFKLAQAIRERIAYTEKIAQVSRNYLPM